ncbi:ABC transporter permease [Evansella cellulosilytica]|uniref:Binding-protein-dependent transport systems inner membrane component n=1 Tax=Evansella cellulosilytica (strain ATCC 21833 / DSM 2522 / FERM P-1141 / JCM 9156 / N-4) TaxID=649639 RepID=E6TZ02_EVAC2|nr:ABC transporter permease [Evansella cellulosilytica]ADU32445.1 binding-protein-dependent transport systems inner membrane component [Evansella cellulosilytica DSM 2522]
MPNAKHSISLISGIFLLAILTILIIGAPWIAPHDPLQQNPSERLEKPSLTYPFGTDRFGRDVLSRTLHGGQTTLLSTLIALSSAIMIGIIVGLLAGIYKGTIIDIFFMRIMDVLLAFPFMVLAIVIAGLFGTSFFHLMIAVISVWWVTFARLTRSVVLQAKTSTSYAAAKILGAKDSVLICKELLPKVMSPVLILATFELGSLILAISALSFLGLGAQPPVAEWGSMLADGRDHFFQAPYILLGPATFIFLTVLSFNLIGEGLRDRLDPYERSEL